MNWYLIETAAFIFVEVYLFLTLRRKGIFKKKQEKQEVEQKNKAVAKVLEDRGEFTDSGGNHYNKYLVEYSIDQVKTVSAYLTEPNIKLDVGSMIELYYISKGTHHELVTNYKLTKENKINNMKITESDYMLYAIFAFIINVGIEAYIMGYFNK